MSMIKDVHCNMISKNKNNWSNLLTTELLTLWNNTNPHTVSRLLLILNLKVFCFM
jgi:hypothetical protein